ncbi:MAG: MBL fold metallo-hydrolase [Ruminococcaceae bacterium]|nr:MBL fold metallo-hydrolase [Oscillospiraceae bacterium]
MSEQRGNSQSNKNARSIILKLIAVIIAAAFIWLLYSIYISKVITWGDVYAAFGISESEELSPEDKMDVLSESGDTRVTFLYVGQGDCIVIEDAGKVAVIDTGEYIEIDRLLSFLETRKITKIDYLIATHPHTDHIGSMQTLVYDYSVSEIIFTSVPDDLTPTNATYINLLKAIDKTGTPVTIPSVGDKISLGDGGFEVLYAGGGSALNNCSLVLIYTVGERSFLLTGDAEFEVEDALAEEFGKRLRCDVLKAGHHGTKYATGNNLLSAAKPEYVVIMCGTDNEYGYPKEQVLGRIADAGGQVLRSDLNGIITFTTDGQSLNVTTERAA